MDNLNGIKSFFFSETKSLTETIKHIIPDVLLLHKPDYYQLISGKGKNVIINHDFPVVVAGSPGKNNIITKAGIRFLSEDFTNTDLINILKGPEQQNRELVFSSEMLDLVIQHIPIALFWKDKDLKYIGCDQLFCKDQGLEEPCDIFGLTDFDLFPREVALGNLLIDRKILESGKPMINYEEKVTNANGHIDFLRKSKIPIKNEQGEVIMIMGLYEKITDHVQTQEHLRNEKHYLQMLMDNIPDTIYFKDRNSRFTRINKAQALTLGLEHPDDAIGKCDADFFDKKHSAQAFDDEQKLMASGLPLINKLEHIRTASGYKYVTATKIPLFDKAKKCVGMVGVSRDVNREHLAEEELRREKELMNLLMDNIPDRIYFKDKDSRFIRANKAIALIFGKENPEELYGKTDFDLHDPEHARQAFEDEQELMKSGIPLINKVESHIQDGSRVWETSTKIPLLDKNKEIIGLVGISRDFTKQKQLEEALAREKDLLQILMDNIPDYIYFKDAGSRYIRINKAVAESLQVKDINEAYGKCDHNFFPKEYADAFLAHEKEILATGNPIIGKIERSILPGGTPIWISTTKMPIKDDNGNITGFVGVSRNVTTEELTKQRFQIAKEKAEEANKAKSLFLANMSHEIRTPMNGVIGMADVLRRTKLDPTQKEYLDIIVKSGNTLLTIINDILDFSKIESGKMSLESCPVSIRNIVEEVADIQIIQANEKRIDLLTFVDADIPEFVNGDYVRIKQIVMNLVNNAIKFTARGEVFVSVEYKGFDGQKHEILFKVRDSGIGIAKENQEKLFKSFSQVDTSTTRRFGGTGLGLAICQRLVQEMGGRFTLESEEGKGSEFSFTAKFDPATEQHETNIRFKTTSFTGLNVLIVDDNFTNRKIFREYLESWQVNVFEATNGRDALKQLQRPDEKRKQIDMALVDYQMAEMDGIELAGKIKADPLLKNIHLILLSSVTDAIPRNELKKHGFEHYLNKPVKLKQLFNAVASVIGKTKQTASDDEKLDIEKTDYIDKCFLIAEDNEVNMKVANFTLKSFCHQILAAYNGQEAVDLFKSQHIDYILMDIQMPVMNGIEATLKIRELEKNQGVEKPVKIIAMTANTMREDVEKCLKSGMDAFLGKPFKVADLVNILREIG